MTNKNEQKRIEFLEDVFVQEALKYGVIRDLFLIGYNITEFDKEKHYFDLHKPYGNFFRVDYKAVVHGHKGLSVYEVKRPK